MFFFGRKSRRGAVSQTLREGLKALARSAFPKRCPGCGRIFSSLDQYLKETYRPGTLEEDDGDGPIRVPLYRRCVCGALMKDCFTDRRDHSDVGVERRALFGELVDNLAAAGVEPEIARSELLSVLAGRPSAVLRVEPAP